VGCFPSGPGSLRTGRHQIGGEAGHALVDKDDPERGQRVVQTDLEAGVRRTQAAQHADRLDAARTPPQRAEPLVRLRPRIDQQEPDRPAVAVEPFQQPVELGPHVGVRDPLRREYPGETQPRDGLRDALQWLELRAAQFELRCGGDTDGLDEAVDSALIVGPPAVLVDLEERIPVAVGNPADRITQLGRDAVGKLLLNAIIGGSRWAVVRGKRCHGTVEQRPQLLVGRILGQQLPYPADCLLDPRLPPAAELTVNDIPLEAIPVTFKFEVGGHKEFVIVIGELERRICMPHAIKFQQLLVPLTDIAVQVVDIGDIAHAMLPDQVLEDKGVDLGLIDGGGIAGRAAYAFLADPATQAANIAGY
jgi:hypothetical protein